MAAPPYDEGNVFARILRGEIPADIVHQTEHAIAFRDLRPQAPVHVLVIPRGAYRDLADFAAHAPAAEQAGFMACVSECVRLLGLEEGGFRAIANAGPNAHQEVPHFHLHLLGGRPLGPLLARA